MRVPRIAPTLFPPTPRSSSNAHDAEQRETLGHCETLQKSLRQGGGTALFCRYPRAVYASACRGATCMRLRRMMACLGRGVYTVPHIQGLRKVLRLRKHVFLKKRRERRTYTWACKKHTEAWREWRKGARRRGSPARPVSSPVPTSLLTSL